MSGHKKILVSLPNSLLQEVDDIVGLDRKDRSEFIRDAMKCYIKERQKDEIREKMRKGYEEMANINSQLTEESDSDIEALLNYEAVLSGHK